MTSGYLLIGAMLILGGIIAVSGDRIGTRVGKARLSLFKLRPRQTATLVTIIAGTTIAASVLTLIFGASEQLRIGVFDLQKIQRKLFDTRENLARALEQKDRVQRELEVARNEQLAAKSLLSGINNSLKDEVLKQSVATQNLKNTKQQLESVSNQRNQLVAEVTEIDRHLRDLTAQQRVIFTQVQEIQVRIDRLETAILPLRQRIISATRQRSQLQQRLNTITVLPNLASEIRRLHTNESKLKKLEQDLEQQIAKLTNLEAQLQAQQTELANLKAQIEQLDRKLVVRQAQLKEKDKQHQKLEREFQNRAMQLKLRNQQLKKIELKIEIDRQGLASLEQEVNNIEQEYHNIQQGNIVILRDRVLASTVLKISSPEATTAAIDNLLAQANLNALQATDPYNTSKQQIIKLAPDRLTQLKQQIADRRTNYAVRIFSIGNYVMGDKNIQVFLDATPNRKLFDRDDQIAEVKIDPTTMNESQIGQQLNTLLVTSQLRARRAGILDDKPQVGDGQLATYVQFSARVKQQKYPIEIRTIVDRDIYTLGPLVVKLQAVARGKVLFNTYSNSSNGR
ncbi:DUF3084 domain-containing protein [Chamaesiphon sp.]|uniref:DUF3084 domain-containing protein n=1 Tax=Chamaesiphon sp. TaxID=2814140 RepID=UPI003593230D